MSPRPSLSSFVPSKAQVSQSVRAFPSKAYDAYRRTFPITQWIHAYNRQWAYGDVIAGITVAMLAIPQALSYAKLAGLPLEHGLYTSFVGVILYCFFATSKDVTIGPTAVLSILVGQVLASYNKDPAISPVSFAVSICLITGIIELVIGMLQLGIIVDFIPDPVIVGFTTGAGIGIIIGQTAGLLGIAGIDTNDAPYRILIAIFSKIATTKLDAAFGLTALTLLLTIKYVSRYYVKKGVEWVRWVDYASNAFTTILFTLISFGVNSPLKTPLIKIVGNVPSGLHYFQAPTFSDLAKTAPAAVTVVIVSILEHIAVVKSYGRVNGYNVDSNQEIIGLGVINLLASFVGGFAATGSFSRSAIKSQSGVKTPLVGFVTGSIVLLSIYVLTPAFYWIPSAVLSALIINGITNLITSPETVKNFYNISYYDFFVFWLALLLTIFFSIEISIYISVGFSILVLLVRVARPRYSVLVQDDFGSWTGINEADANLKSYKSSPNGVFVFRIEESLTYPNSDYVNEKLRLWLKTHSKASEVQVSQGKQLWSHVAEEAERRRKSGNVVKDDFYLITRSQPKLARLSVVIFDLSAVNDIDSTGIQRFADLKRDLERYSGQSVLFYFVNVRKRYAHIIEYFDKLLLETELSKKDDPSVKAYVFDTISEAVNAAREYAADDVSSNETIEDFTSQVPNSSVIVSVEKS